MTSPGTPDGGRPAATAGPGWARRFRAMPGFRAAATAFVLVVLLGFGGVALAQWQQSATATIAITAGAAAVPPPPASLVVANPELATRPSVLDPGGVACRSSLPQPALKNKDHADMRFSWPESEHAATYSVTLTYDDPGYAFALTQAVTNEKAIFTLDRKPAAYGRYTLRIQPMNDSTAGDAIYRKYLYTEDESDNCSYLDPAGRSPLGTPAVSALDLVKHAASADMSIVWTAAPGATSYAVTLHSTSAAKQEFGLETTVTGLGITLTFPRAASNQDGSPVNPNDVNAPYYSDYSLRIQPMNGTTAGDPVYKTVRYYHRSSSLAD